MFNKIFNLDIKEVNSKKALIYRPALAIKKPQSIKPDVLKRFEMILDEIQNVNNSKADALRKLFFYLQSENLNTTDLIAFVKQPIIKPKKKTTIKLNKI